MSSLCVVLFSCCVGLSVTQQLYPDFSFTNKECEPNEVYDCVFPCPSEKTCRNRKINIYCTEEIQICSQKCVCKEGFFRETEGEKCIPEEECGPACDDYETYTDCKPSCSKDTCSSLNTSLDCDSKKPCKPGCVCRDGMLKENEDAQCMHFCLCNEAESLPNCTDWRKRYSFLINTPHK